MLGYLLKLYVSFCLGEENSESSNLVLINLFEGLVFNYLIFLFFWKKNDGNFKLLIRIDVMFNMVFMKNCWKFDYCFKYYVL